MSTEAEKVNLTQDEQTLLRFLYKSGAINTAQICTGLGWDGQRTSEALVGLRAKGLIDGGPVS